MRRTRRIIMRPGQSFKELDLWPGDEVWWEDLTLIGKVNSEGQLVPHLQALN